MLHGTQAGIDTSGSLHAGCTWCHGGPRPTGKAHSVTPPGQMLQGWAGPARLGQLGVLAKRIAPLCRLGSAPRRHGVDGRHLAGSPLWHLQAAAHDKLKHSKVAGLMKGYNWAWAHMTAHGGVGCMNPM